MKHKRILLIVTLILAISVLAAGCSRQPAEKTGVTGATDVRVTVTDGLNRRVEIKGVPKRVVSLAPSNTEIVFALGAGTTLVGVDEYSDYPEETKKIPRVGGFSNPNLELIIASKPDLILADDIHTSMIDQLSKVGCPVVLLRGNSPAEVQHNIQIVGQILDKTKEAEALVADIKKRLEAVKQKVQSVPPEKRPKVFYEVYSDPIMTAGPKTLIHSIIEAAGGQNVASDAATDWPQYSSEMIVQKNPEVILFPYFHGGESLTVEKIKTRPGWSGISAVLKKRVYPIDANIISRPGPRIAQAVEELARLFYPELFK
ncbi:MAG TPA: cobalamin-binding protein [Firmicutes bacterium]|nr:cobalamin-binding protein [Bacillota bacterium]